MTTEIFTTPNCPRCAYLKKLLDEAGIGYTQVDVTAGLGPLRRLRQLSGAALVPVVVRGREVWPAFTPEAARAVVRALEDR
ncbi:MAG: glutaredoxin family protein [Deltaproteobacteria bacterium]|nr:glutaredoxin family protein [Deltaproteobacteria bacterium]